MKFLTKKLDKTSFNLQSPIKKHTKRMNIFLSRLRGGPGGKAEEVVGRPGTRPPPSHSSVSSSAGLLSRTQFTRPSQKYSWLIHWSPNYHQVVTKIHQTIIGPI